MQSNYKTLNGYTFKVLKPTSAKGRALLASANYCKGGDIYEAYERPSAYKVKAWRDIVEFSASIKAQACYITGANCSTFSAVTIKRNANGAREVYYFTAYNNYLIIE